MDLRIRVGLKTSFLIKNDFKHLVNRFNKMWVKLTPREKRLKIEYWI